MSNASVTVIKAQTAAATMSYDTDSVTGKGCAIIFHAAPLVAAETVTISVAGEGGNAALFQDGLAVVLSATNPIQQVSIGPLYVLTKSVTATACGVSACPVGR